MIDLEVGVTPDAGVWGREVNEALHSCKLEVKAALIVGWGRLVVFGCDDEVWIGSGGEV